MRASLRHFRIFVATAETGQISKAAATLFTSQPVVTESVKALEAEIGVKLFERHAKGVTLTSEGSVFLRHARAVIAAAAEAMQAPQRVRRDMTGVLKVACNHTVAGYYLPTLLARFQRQYPGIRVELAEMPRARIEESLLNGESEIAACLITPLQHLNELETEVLTRSKRRLWLPANHALLGQQRITLKEVQPEPYVLLTIDDSEQTTMRYWQAAGLQPNVVFKTTSMEATRNLVALGFGVTILSDMVYRPWSLDNSRLEAVTLADSLPSMDVGLAWKSGVEPGRYAAAFIDVCRSLRLETG